MSLFKNTCYSLSLCVLQVDSQLLRRGSLNTANVRIMRATWLAYAIWGYLMSLKSVTVTICLLVARPVPSSAHSLLKCCHSSTLEAQRTQQIWTSSKSMVSPTSSMWPQMSPTHLKMRRILNTCRFQSLTTGLRISPRFFHKQSNL